MKSEMEIIEAYIDYHMEREFVESLTIEEQVLYKCQLRGTISFMLFSIHTRLKEFFGELQTIFDCSHMDG